jgi:hypothetical protein
MLIGASVHVLQDQLTACTNIYVEEALVQQFGDLVRFVTEAEAAAKAGSVAEGSHAPGYGPQQAAPIMKDFSTRWTAAIEALNKCAAQLCPLGTFTRQICGNSV